MKVLIICDDHFHPGTVVEEGVRPLKDKGYEFDVIKNGDEFRTEALADYPVVLLSKSDDATPDNRSSWKSNEIQQAFINYVESGGGFLVVHSGTVAGKDTGALDRLVGSKFTFHPEACEVFIEPIKPHPVTEGVAMFSEMDEHYYLEILNDDVDIIMASYAPEKIAPCCYVRTQGKGRVCVLTPGHTPAMWQNPGFQQTLDNGLRWCAGQEKNRLT